MKPFVFMLCLLVVGVAVFIWYQQPPALQKQQPPAVVAANRASMRIPVIQVNASGRVSTDTKATPPAVFGLAKLEGTGIVLRKDSDGVGNGCAVWQLSEALENRFALQMEFEFKCESPRKAGRAYGDGLAVIMCAEHATLDQSDGLWIIFNETANTYEVRWLGRTIVAPMTANSNGSVRVNVAFLHNFGATEMYALTVQINGKPAVYGDYIPHNFVFSGQYIGVCAWSRDATDTFRVTRGDISIQKTQNETRTAGAEQRAPVPTNQATVSMPPVIAPSNPFITSMTIAPNILKDAKPTVVVTPQIEAGMQIPVIQASGQTNTDAKKTPPAVFGLAKLEGNGSIVLRKDSDGVGNGFAVWQLSEALKNDYVLFMQCSFKCESPRKADRLYGDGLAVILCAEHATPNQSDGLWTIFNETANTCEVRLHGKTIVPPMAAPVNSSSIDVLLSSNHELDGLFSLTVIISGKALVRGQYIPRDAVFNGQYISLYAWSRDATDTFNITNVVIMKQ